MNPFLEAAFDEVFRKLDEIEARLERHFSQPKTAEELCIAGLEQFGTTEPIVADNWGGLFEEISAFSHQPVLAPDAAFASEFSSTDAEATFTDALSPSAVAVQAVLLPQAHEDETPNHLGTDVELDLHDLPMRPPSSRIQAVGYLLDSLMEKLPSRAAAFVLPTASLADRLPWDRICKEIGLISYLCNIRNPCAEDDGADDPVDPGPKFASPLFPPPYARFASGHLVIDFMGEAFGLQLLPPSANKGTNFRKSPSMRICLYNIKLFGWWNDAGWRCRDVRGATLGVQPLSCAELATAGDAADGTDFAAFMLVDRAILAYTTAASDEAYATYVVLVPVVDIDITIIAQTKCSMKWASTGISILGSTLAAEAAPTSSAMFSGLRGLIPRLLMPNPSWFHSIPAAMKHFLAIKQKQVLTCKSSLICFHSSTVGPTPVCDEGNFQHSFCPSSVLDEVIFWSLPMRGAEQQPWPPPLHHEFRSYGIKLECMARSSRPIDDGSSKACSCVWIEKPPWPLPGQHNFGWSSTAVWLCSSFDRDDQCTHNSDMHGVRQFLTFAPNCTDRSAIPSLCAKQTWLVNWNSRASKSSDGSGKPNALVVHRNQLVVFLQHTNGDWLLAFRVQEFQLKSLLVDTYILWLLYRKAGQKVLDRTLRFQNLVQSLVHITTFAEQMLLEFLNDGQLVGSLVQCPELLQQPPWPFSYSSQTTVVTRARFRSYNEISVQDTIMKPVTPADQPHSHIPSGMLVTELSIAAIVMHNVHSLQHAFQGTCDIAGRAATTTFPWYLLLLEQFMNLVVWLPKVKVRPSLLTKAHELPRVVHGKMQSLWSYDEMMEDHLKFSVPGWLCHTTCDIYIFPSELNAAKGNVLFSHAKTTHLRCMLSFRFPWDPGGIYVMHRLEGKPNFKEGRMLGTCEMCCQLGPSCQAEQGQINDTKRLDGSGKGHQRIFTNIIPIS